MSWIEAALTRLEARLRLMIEGNAAWDGFPRRLHHVLERRLIQAMKSGACQVPDVTTSSGHSLIAPDQYILILPAVEAQVLLTHPTELDRLIRKLENTASQAGMVFVSAPTLRVVADPHSLEMSIFAEFYQPGLGDSSTTDMGVLPQVSSEKLPKAYLIVNGLATFTITSPVVNIGRDPSNQLRLDDPQISWLHAQLRLVQGRFVIFDLDSRGGTLVNGVPVSSHALNPGDVIQLGGVPLVYGQDFPELAGQTQELPVVPKPPEVL